MRNTAVHKSQSQIQGQERSKLKCDFLVRDIVKIIRLQALYFSEAKIHMNTIKIYRPLKAIEKYSFINVMEVSFNFKQYFHDCI